MSKNTFIIYLRKHFVLLTTKFENNKRKFFLSNNTTNIQHQHPTNAPNLFTWPCG